MNDERNDDTIDEKDLPPAGNSKGRLYPPAGKDEAGTDDDPQQAPHGDAAAVRGGGPGPNDAE